MLPLVLAHLVVAGLLPWVAARSHRAAFGVGALLPVAALLWMLTNAADALGDGVTSSAAWAPALGLTLSFRLDALALAMVVLVSGLGAVVLVYCIGYFAPASPEAPRCAALLVAFAGLMLGLVLADDLLTLYVFWELTSIASFLLVGQGGGEREGRRAAVQALLVTVAGGLAMLLGFVLLGEAAGTYRISEIVAAGQAGVLEVGPAALLLILVGAFTKSAQLPFHPWLPAAMVAPTPVSAYLHAAAMVKAGVYLVARLSPAFADRAVWWVPVVVAGLATMLVGGWRALAETDLKRLLAFGTVSQLGFLMVLLGAGSRVAALAGLAMLLAHGLFKAPLFLAVGAIDHATGSRDLRELSGLGAAMPGLAAASALAAASMAGLPPLVGFVGKEAAFAAFLHEGGPRGWLLALGILAGSVLTAAYTARFLWGAFARKDDGPDDRQMAPRCDPGAAGTAEWRHRAHEGVGRLLSGPVWVSAVGGLGLGVGYPLVDVVGQRYAGVYLAVGAEYHLALWHGVGLPLLFSAVALGGGYLLHRARGPLRRLHGRTPEVFDAQHGYETVVGGIGRLAVRVTGAVQAGSLPGYLGVILAVLIALPGTTVLLSGSLPADQPLYHSALQVPLGIAVLVAAAALVRARRRFTAVLMVGAIGYGLGGLFIVDGAPDLALAQFLVETLSLVVFVLVLRRLPAHFSEERTARRRVRVPKAVVAVTGGAVVALTAVVLSGARTQPASAAADLVALAPTEAGATNVVSAIIVDFRALDTVAEITVLFAAAAGTASLVLATRHDRRRRSGDGPASGSGGPEHEREVLG